MPKQVPANLEEMADFLNGLLDWMESAKDQANTSGKRPWSQKRLGYFYEGIDMAQKAVVAYLEEVGFAVAERKSVPVPVPVVEKVA